MGLIGLRSSIQQHTKHLRMEYEIQTRQPECRGDPCYLNVHLNDVRSLLFTFSLRVCLIPLKCLLPLLN